MEEIDLSDFFTTKAEAIDFSERLSTLSEKIYENNFDLEKALQEIFGMRKKEKFISLLRKNKITPGSAQILTKFIEKIHNTISSLPHVTLTLAIEPNDQILKSIIDWFILNYKKQVLLDIKINPKIVAGAIVGFQGKQLNASVKEVFNMVCAPSSDLVASQHNIDNETNGQQLAPKS